METKVTVNHEDKSVSLTFGETTVVLSEVEFKEFSLKVKNARFSQAFYKKKPNRPYHEGKYNSLRIKGGA